MQRPQYHLNTVHGSFSTDCRKAKKSVVPGYEYVNIRRKHTDTMDGLRSGRTGHGVVFERTLMITTTPFGTAPGRLAGYGL